MSRKKRFKKLVKNVEKLKKIDESLGERSNYITKKLTIPDKKDARMTEAQRKAMVNNFFRGRT